MKLNMADYFKPHPKQQEALAYVGKGQRIYYGGARGGGKSALAMYAAVIMCLKYPKLRCVCIRRRYKELDEGLVSNELLKKYPPDVFRYRYRKTDKKATFSNGSSIQFQQCDTPADAEKIQGVEYHLMVIDEANNLDEMTIHKLFGSLRNPPKGFKVTLLMTGNPGGMSDMYFKSRFVEPDFTLWEPYELEHRDDYVFIKAQYHDNPTCAEEYGKLLDSLPEDLRRAWKDGNFDIFQGQFFREFHPKRHVVAPFPVPSHWRRVFGVDAGWTRKHPFVFLFGAQDPATDVIYIYKEVVAFNCSTDTACQMVLDATDIHDRACGYADPSMWGTVRKEHECDEATAYILMRHGIPVMPANNSRVEGWRVLKQWLSWSEGRMPMLRIFETCQFLIQTLPLNRYDTNTRKTSEDLFTDGPDDAADALRYLVHSAFYYPVEEKIIISEQTANDEEKNKVLTPDEIFSRLSQIGYPEEIEETDDFRDRAGNEFIGVESWYG